MNSSSKSLLRKLAVAPRPRQSAQIRYDRATQTAQILEEGGWTDSWLAPSLQGTKKRDIETGEDAKGE